MSTENTPELRAACEDSGVTDFVHKENFREEFRAMLERAERSRMAGNSIAAINRFAALIAKNGEK